MGKPRCTCGWEGAPSRCPRCDPKPLSVAVWTTWLWLTILKLR